MARRVRVGINGWGRIGRLAARFLMAESARVGACATLELVHVNDPALDAPSMAYLFEFDSAHGRYGGAVAVEGDGAALVLDGQRVTVSREARLREAWTGRGVELVLECSGKFTDEAKLREYFAAGVARVLVSAPVNGAVNVVLGCNEAEVLPSTAVVTAASCTTNCIGPVIKSLDAAFGIERGSINTVHNITNTQTLLDGPNGKKEDPRRSRSGLVNLAPTTTGSAKAITLIFPHLQGKLNGVAIRVPLHNASLTDLTLQLKTDVTVDSVNRALQESAARNPAVLGFETRPLVSSDYLNDPRSSIVDALSTQVVDKRLVKVLAWYDNEFGYAKRMHDLANLMAGQLLQERRAKL
jgi:glyceraldehyde 3-phosphate dehydrogenase